jgi:hypothetical protein
MKTLSNNCITNKIPLTELNKKFNVKLNIDFKNLKINQNQNQHHYQNQNEENFLNEKEHIFYREKWPLPDDYFINKNTKKLPKKNSNLSYLISNEILFDIPCKIQDMDEYEIYDNEIIIKLFEYFPDLTLNEIYKEIKIINFNKEIIHSNEIINKEKEKDNLKGIFGSLSYNSNKNFKQINYLKFYFEIFLNIFDPNFSNDNNNYNKNINFNKSFAVLKFVLPIKLLKEYNIQGGNKNENEKFSDFLKRIFNYNSENMDNIIKKDKDKETDNNNNNKDINNKDKDKVNDNDNDNDLIINEIMKNKIDLNLNLNKENNNNLINELNINTDLNINLINPITNENENDLYNNNNNNYKDKRNNNINNNNNEKINKIPFNLNGVKIKFCVLPYNYKEFFDIINSFEKVKK